MPSILFSVNCIYNYTYVKITSIFIPLVFFCLVGCAQNDDHNFHAPGKIPIDSKRWYQVTNSTYGMEELFDNNQFQKPNTGYNKLVPHYDAWYPLLEGEQMTIDSIMFYCWRNIDKNHPVTIYAVQKDWKRVPIAVFTGERATTWEGPDPQQPGKFGLKQPVSGFRYLIINSWGEFPGEIEFYGAYTAPKPMGGFEPPSSPLGNYFGVNAYEWNFEDSKNPADVDTARLGPIKSFSGVRHYMDWQQLELTEGKYTFNPVRNGGWNYDAIYGWCKEQHIELLACLKTIPKWMEETYPEGQRNNENVPVKFGKDLSDPTSYIEQAKVAFQYTARYGSNKTIDIGLLKADATERWQGDKKNEIKVGLDLVHYIECDNERDKWWKGRAAYQTSREYAANLSAFYDGHKGKLGPGAGVKNADPAMMVVMAGLANPDPGYLRGMIDWCREFRGYKADGSIDLPWDVINYHFYCNDANDNPGKEQTVGVAPELTVAGKVATEFVQLAHRYAKDMPVWVTEAGYDINPGSTQRAIAINNKTALETQADWTLRTSFLYARSGIQRVFYYQLYDDNATSSTKYGTSGLIDSNRHRRPVADYLMQVKQQFGSYKYVSTISRDPLVDKYTCNNQRMYMLVVPDQKGRTSSYTLDLGKAKTACIYTPKAGDNKMELARKRTTDGKIILLVSETPMFVTGE